MALEGIALFETNNGPLCIRFTQKVIRIGLYKFVNKVLSNRTVTILRFVRLEPSLFEISMD